MLSDKGFGITKILEHKVLLMPTLYKVRRLISWNEVIADIYEVSLNMYIV